MTRNMFKRSRRSATILAIALGAAGFIGVSQLLSASTAEPNGDLAKLQGTWHRVSSEFQGKDMPLGANPEKNLDLRLVVKDNTLTFGRNDVETFVLEPDRSPKSIDLVPIDDSAGVLKDKEYRAIYKLDGDTLTLCLDPHSQNRPTEFASAPKSGVWLDVYQRVKGDR